MALQGHGITVLRPYCFSFPCFTVKTDLWLNNLVDLSFGDVVKVCDVIFPKNGKKKGSSSKTLGFTSEKPSLMPGTCSARWRQGRNLEEAATAWRLSYHRDQGRSSRDEGVWLRRGSQVW
ncbi:hypothetical protein PoB_000146500 [Plakobranchus ocellatus]|uniref:Uncharacterized protein n=1 Tax=Plakobranchus ocellatus TaxID=259542 RepID=A0AAV3XVW7_9GAST|nr:hypothetical protein PoB_000146500 [Plakobranchus ocellatus]